MAYEWPKRLIDPKDGIPYSKKPDVYLEKTDASGKVIGRDTFCTQSEVDKAWADGWHVPNFPETRDVWPINPKPDVTEAVSDDSLMDFELIPAGAEEFEEEKPVKKKYNKKGK